MIDGLLAAILFLFDNVFVDPTTNVLVALARLFGGNYGIAIIVFTLVMKVVTWPLTSSQYKQSRAMQAIQPQMQELQKKYKGKDPKKLQSETMALYKEAGVNPLGCLFPMLAQFPIWIALYQVIRVSLGDAPESLITLSQRLYPISFVHSAVPLNNQLLFWNLGQPDGTYILPFLVAASMYVQQKIITPAPTSAPATQQAQQQQQTQQMMTWMMPLMFGAFSLNVPAGLALYWFVSNLSGVVLQYFYMGRKIDWKYMLQFGPAAAAPATKGATNGRQAAVKVARPAREQKALDATEPDELVADNGTGEGPDPDVRRKRHGRRRGKR